MQICFFGFYGARSQIDALHFACVGSLLNFHSSCQDIMEYYHQGRIFLPSAWQFLQWVVFREDLIFLMHLVLHLTDLSRHLQSPTEEDLLLHPTFFCYGGRMLLALIRNHLGL